MEKYSREHIEHLERGGPYFTMHGCRSEIVTRFLQSNKPLPLRVEYIGITYPDPQYYIYRYSGKANVLEYIVSGKGYVIHDGVRKEVKAGDAYLLMSETRHEYFADPDDPYEKYWVNFNGDLFKETMRRYELDADPVYLNVNLRSRFENLFALEHVSLRNEDIYPEASAILFDCMMELVRSRRTTQFVPPVIAAARNEIDKNLTEPLNIDALAASLFISKSQLTRGFKKYYTTSPYRYYTERRLDFAKELLTNGNRSIREIAEILHFTNEHYFSAAFKQNAGVPPHIYRLQSREPLV